MVSITLQFIINQVLPINTFVQVRIHLSNFVYIFRGRPISKTAANVHLLRSDHSHQLAIERCQLTQNYLQRGVLQRGSLISNLNVLNLKMIFVHIASAKYMLVLTETQNAIYRCLFFFPFTNTEKSFLVISLLSHSQFHHCRSRFLIEEHLLGSITPLELRERLNLLLFLLLFLFSRYEPGDGLKMTCMAQQTGGGSKGFPKEERTGVIRERRLCQKQARAIRQGGVGEG